MESRENKTTHKMLTDKEDTMNGEGDYYLPPPTPRESKILTEIHKKKYSEGDTGKLEALNDLQNVFDELFQENVIKDPMDLMSPYKEQYDKMQKKKAKQSIRTKTLTPKSNIKFKPYKSQIDYDHPFQSISAPNLLIQDEEKPILKWQTIEIDVENAFRTVQEDLLHEGETSSESEDNSETEVESRKSEKLSQERSWRKDIETLARLKSKSKVKASLESDRECLQLKYTPGILEPLHQILSKQESLSCLILDGSKLECLCDLGNSLPSLTTLSVAGCGLHTLDGTFAFPNLRTLVASNNNLEQVTECSLLLELAHLDCSSNPIVDIEPFAFLKVCKKLRSLKLYSTPLSKLSDFYPHMKYLLPHVKELNPFSHYSGWTGWTKKPSKEDVKKEEDLQEKLRRQEFDVIYQSNFARKLMPNCIAANKTPRREDDERIVGVSTDDSFENLLIKSVMRPEDEEESESYITEVEEGDISGGVDGDCESFVATDSSPSELDFSSGWENIN